MKSHLHRKFEIAALFQTLSKQDCLCWEAGNSNEGFETWRWVLQKMHSYFDLAVNDPSEFIQIPTCCKKVHHPIQTWIKMSCLVGVKQSDFLSFYWAEQLDFGERDSLIQCQWTIKWGVSEINGQIGIDWGVSCPFWKKKVDMRGGGRHPWKK